MASNLVDIPTLREYLAKKMDESTSLVLNKDKDHNETMYERGKYAALRQLKHEFKL